VTTSVPVQFSAGAGYDEYTTGLGFRGRTLDPPESV